MSRIKEIFLNILFTPVAIVIGVWGALFGDEVGFNQSLAKNFAGIMAFLHGLVYILLVVYVVGNILIEFDIVSALNSGRYTEIELVNQIMQFIFDGNSIAAILKAFLFWMAYSIVFGLLSTFISINEQLEKLNEKLDHR